MAQPIKSLPYKHKDLSSIPQNPHKEKKKQMQWNTFVIPALGRQRQANSWGSLASQLSRLSKLRSLSQNKADSSSEEQCPRLSSGFYIHKCMYVLSTHVHMHTQKDLKGSF